MEGVRQAFDVEYWEMIITREDDLCDALFEKREGKKFSGAIFTFNKLNLNKY